MKIEAVKAKNFKIFEKERNYIDKIASTEAVILSGPNGYGKTTVFDAIEFGLTGKIERISIYNTNLKINKRKKYEKPILIDCDKDSYVEVDLVHEGKTIKVRRIRKRGNSKSNPVTIFDEYSLFVTVDGKELKSSEAEDFIRKSGVRDFFNACCFLSQDEHLSFLKESNDSKVDRLNFLFDIPQDMLNKLEKTKAIIDELSNSKAIKNRKLLQRLEDYREELSKRIRNIEIDGIDVGKQIKFERLFDSIDLSWDREEMNLSKEEYEQALVDIENISFFLKRPEDCEKYAKNVVYEPLLKKYSGAVDTLSSGLEFAFRFGWVKDYYKNYKNQYDMEQDCKQIRQEILKRKLEDISFPLILKQGLLNKGEVDDLMEMVKRIEVAEKRIGGISSIINELTEARKILEVSTKSAKKQGIFRPDRCPLCGAEYVTEQTLKNAIQKVDKELASLSSGALVEIEDDKNRIYKKYLNKVLTEIDRRLEQPLSDAFFSLVTRVNKRKNEILTIEQKLDELGVKMQYARPDEYNDAENGYTELVNAIRSKIPEIDIRTKQLLDDKNFERYYDLFLGRDITILNNMSIKQLDCKKKYISWKYYETGKEKRKALEQELQVVDDRIRKVKLIKQNLDSYYEALDNGIKNYKKKTVKEIGPLLYLYSGKVLQQRMQGDGIFFVVDDDLSNVHLCASFSDNNDILYSMSSGQLTSVAITFLLCMNKIYAGRKKVEFLLIDDPIQTMDDINMVGLIDLLRDAFGNTQLIISTHEEKFERYLSYKYTKSGKNVKSIHMKSVVMDID